MIDTFHGKYRFLSNFWPAWVEFEGVMYPTVEHAYVASKTCLLIERAQVLTIPRSQAGKVKRIGRTLTLRADWNEVKLGIMTDLVEQKFFRHPKLSIALLATGNQELVEGNHWNDTYWGVCRGVGENHLGKILMKVRSDIVREGISPKPPTPSTDDEDDDGYDPSVERFKRLDLD